jgi:hypothetical protein
METWVKHWTPHSKYDKFRNKKQARKSIFCQGAEQTMGHRFYKAISLIPVILISAGIFAASGEPVEGTSGLIDSSTIGEILKKADQARGNRDGITWEVAILSAENTGRGPMIFHVRARGFDTLATALSPPKDKGNKVLMVNGNMWFYKPGLSKPVPISARQKLMGNASYGDIAATNYYRDYDATLLGDETIADESCHVFDLKAKMPTATYDHIRYWVSKNREVGIKAEYYTVSGKKIKTARMFYNREIDVDGIRRPFISEIHIADAFVTKDTTVLAFDKPALAALPDHIFNRNLLRN